jgi:hypothetical protein
MSGCLGIFVDGHGYETVFTEETEWTPVPRRCSAPARPNRGARARGRAVAGYGEFEFVGFLAVTAPGLDELERSCAEFEQAAAQAGLELRRLDGRHDLALACMLPIGRSIAPRRFAGTVALIRIGPRSIESPSRFGFRSFGRVR